MFQCVCSKLGPLLLRMDVIAFYNYKLLLMPFRSNKVLCLHVVEWINDGDIFRIKNTVNQALQYTRKKLLLDWLIDNR